MLDTPLPLQTVNQAARAGMPPKVHGVQLYFGVRGSPRPRSAGALRADNLQVNRAREREVVGLLGLTADLRLDMRPKHTGSDTSPVLCLACASSDIGLSSRGLWLTEREPLQQTVQGASEVLLSVSDRQMTDLTRS